MTSNEYLLTANLEAEAMSLVARDPDRAAEILARILQVDADRLSTLRALARLLMRHSRFEEAQAHWSRISVLASRDVEARMGLSRLHVRAGRGLDALEQLAEVLRINPAHIDALRLRTNIRRKELDAIHSRIGHESFSQLETRIGALEKYFLDDQEIRYLKLLGSSIGQDKRDTAPTHRHPAYDHDSVDNLDERAVGDPLEIDLYKLQGRISSAVVPISAEEEQGIERETNRVLAEHPRFATSIARIYIERGDVKRAIDMYRRLSKDHTATHVWIEAAEFAGRVGETGAVVEFCSRAICAPDVNKAVQTKAVSLLRRADEHTMAIKLLRDQPGYQNNLDAQRMVVRILFELCRDDDVAVEARTVLECCAPLGLQSNDRLPSIVDVIRKLRQSVWRSQGSISLATHRELLRQPNENCAITNWALGAIESAELNFPDAILYFEKALGLPALPPACKVNLFAEIAAVHERTHHFGDAFVAMRSMGNIQHPVANYQALERVTRVVEFCGWRENLCYPECLIDIVLDEVRLKPIGYAPQENHIFTITSSLRAGGSERQTVTVAGRMATDARVGNLVLAIRSLESGDDGGSFLKAARELPIEIVHYGEEWRKRSELLEDLPQLEGRRRLIEALDLMPHNLREDIIRICKLILRHRPQAVHLRQDLFGPAIACAIAGVPRYMIHRGSLAPNHWGRSISEFNHLLRPMLHTYRRLLERAEFSIVNNSAAGSESDRAWTDWPDPSPFRVVYNAIDFDKIDHRAEPARNLRAELGIPADAFLIGGVFRLEAVKRPLFWVEIAALVASRCDSAYFIVLGAGSLLEQMLVFAKTIGISDRFHATGFVSDIGQWLRVLDLNLLTSNREGLPNVLIEGQHFGVPVVASDVGGVSETVELDITGKLIQADAPAAVYADAILEIIADEPWRTNARRRGPAFVHAKFGAKRTIDELLGEFTRRASGTQGGVM